MDELRTHYVESMESSGEMTRTEAEARFDQLMHAILVKQETATMTLNPEEWKTKRETVARAMWDKSEWDISARCGNAIKPWHWLTEEGRSPFRNQADTAMTAMGFTRT